MTDISKDAHLYGKVRESAVLKWALPGSLFVLEDENGVKSMCHLPEDGEAEALFSFDSGEWALDDDAAARLVERVLRDGEPVETE